MSPPIPPGRLFFSGELFFLPFRDPKIPGETFFLYVGSVLAILLGTSFKILPNTQATNKKKNFAPGIFFLGETFFFVRRPRLPDVAGFFVRRVRLGFPFFGVQNWRNFKLSGHPRFGHLSHFGVRGLGSGGGEDPGPIRPSNASDVWQPLVYVFGRSPSAAQRPAFFCTFFSLCVFSSPYLTETGTETATATETETETETATEIETD